MNCPRLCVPLAALALVAQSCGFLTDSYTAKTRKTIEVDHLPGSGIDVTSRNGSITVVGGHQAKGVVIEASIVAGGATQQEADDRLDRIVVSCTRDAANTLVVEAVYPDEPRSRDGVSYVLRMPGADNARLRTSNGAVTAQGISGTLDVGTSNGSIKVSDHGGSIRLSSSNGSVKVSGQRGSVVAHTSNGAVSVELQSDQTGPLDLQTSNGAVDVVVGAAFRGEMGMRTSNGRVRVRNASKSRVSTDMAKRHGTVRFSDHPQRSQLRSSNGSITVSVRD